MFGPSKVVEREIVQELDVSAAVAWWNYWDHEHVAMVHGSSYVDLQILYEDRRTAVCLTTFRLPLFRFVKSRSLDVMIQHDPETLLVYNLGLLGIPSRTRVRIRQVGASRCSFTMNYRFLLCGWTAILAPLLPRMIERWNRRVWTEDLPLKTRRQKVREWGFRDFAGLPERLSDRTAADEAELRLPLPRLANSHVDRLRQLLDG